MTDFAPSRAPGMRSIPPSLTGHCGSPVTKPDFRHNCAALRRAGHGRAPTRGRPERFANPASAGRFPRRRHEQKNRDRDGRKTKNVRRARRNDAKKIERARGGANACRRPMEAAAARWLAPLRPFCLTSCGVFLASGGGGCGTVSVVQGRRLAVVVPPRRRPNARLPSVVRICWLFLRQSP
jgi:hypothetical protein